MGGTGKTTLAKEVGKELKKSKQFTHVIDTTVSFSPDIKKIQDDIAGSLGLNFFDCSESDRPKKLWSRLTNGEKILLILDDVWWGDINFDEIGIPHSDNHKGCRILITTRNVSVCNKLECSRTVQLELLSEKDAWTMFKRHAGLSEISNKYLLNKGRKIANECKGLPIAIAVIASSLKGEQRLEEWDGALNSLQKHMSMYGVDDQLVKIHKCLKFSYDNMKNDFAKRLFLLCSVFREDEVIPIERLIRLGIGAGLFGENYGSYEDARTEVVQSTNKLLDSCLLLQANKNSVKMHDLVRDAAQRISNKEVQTIKLDDKNQNAMVEREKNIKYLLCEGKLNDVFSYKLDGSRLEILIVVVYKDEDYHDVKINVLDSFFENNNGLRVFHLFYNYPSYYLGFSLPQSIQSLKNIRSLLFMYIDLGDISILGNLQSLETLELDQCIINELPHGITNLEKLRLLQLDLCGILRNNPFEVIKGCSSLEELYFTCSFNAFCREISFPNELRRFCISDVWRKLIDSSSNCVSFVDKIDIFLSETTLKYCMQEAEVLRLTRMEGGWRNIIPEIVPMDHGMNDLVELNLISISQLHCLIDTQHTDSQFPNVFSKLVVLDLWNLENLEELFNGPVSFDSLNNLEKLSIKNCEHLQSLFKCKLNLCNLKSVTLEGCPLLTSLFQPSTARCLVLLEVLEILECECLVNIIKDERKEEELSSVIVDDSIDRKSHGSMLPKLKVLTIENCPELEFIFSFPSAHDLPAVQSIRIRSCDKLKYIFGKNVPLGSLETMKLDGIPNLIDIFPECNHTMSTSIKGPSYTSGDASKPQAESGPMKCNIFSQTDIYCCGKKFGNKLRSTTSTNIPFVSQDQRQDNLMESNSYCLNIWERAQCLSRQSHILYNIKEIRLGYISKMKSVFILSTAPRMLLETLCISNCDELKHIIVDTGENDSGGNNLGNVFPKLKYLYIGDCEKLEYILGHYTHDHQNLLKIDLHLCSLESLSLCNLPSLVAICPKQCHITFPPLKNFELKNCSQVSTVKSISDFITHHSVTRFVDNTIIKELSVNVEHFISLKRLMVENNSKVESIFCLNEEKMNLGFEDIDLYIMPMMTFLFVGPKNSFFLQNLTRLKIMHCEKLKTVFSTSIVRCLPQLLFMRIEECKELKHIIEYDLENKNSSNFISTKTCFPKLKTLIVVKCNQLKYVFPMSICKELPELEVLIIREAELEEIFVSEKDDQKLEIPNLKLVVFVNLPSLCHVQGIQLQAVKHHLVQNCQKLVSASTADLGNDIYRFELCYGTHSIQSF
ncbi:probable disease resistance protein At1g58602 [Medicago truncatula]|uniref:probable disease resistance protein At1g58602 n=1 Tax=Medicago truncatula TaxID=3880 RepID=UPI0019675235|nr:probable disease resistance protein At1g58602 [Medicago truncatula]